MRSANRAAPDAVLTLLAALLLLQLAGRVEATRWTEGLGVASLLLFGGYLLGLLAGASRFPGALVAFLAVVETLPGVPLALAGWTGRGMDLHSRWTLVAARLHAAWGAFRADRPVEDPILFLAGLGILAWWLGWWVGFWVARRGALWRVVLPPAGALWLVQAYDPLVAARSLYLYAYFVLSLVYLARVVYRQRLALWRKRRALVPWELGWDWLRAAVFVALVVGLLAWRAPAWAASLPPAQDLWQRVVQPWERVQRRLARAVEGLRPSARLEPVPYGERLALGTGVPEQDALVFTVQAPPPPEGVRFYWRARVYTTYRRGEWFIEDARRLAPDVARLPRPPFGEPADFTVALMRYAGTFYTDLYPQEIEGQTYRVQGLPWMADQVDPLAFLPPQPLPPFSSYRLRSWIFPLEADLLRAAGTDYPPEIAPYLQLPPDLPEEVLALAEQLARLGDNPYDRARAVTGYLRAHIAYQNPIPPPPEGMEPIAWFLFDFQAGFCNYYATAEVLLLRAMGIPARLAVGYAQGVYDPQTGVYQVRERDAHAWPEVYFPGVGWVPFEPTASQPPLRRPGDISPGVVGEPEPLPDLTPFPLAPRPPREVEPQVPEAPSGVQEVAWWQRWAAWVWRGVRWALLFMALVWLLQRPFVPRWLLRGVVRWTGKRPRWLVLWLWWTEVGEVQRAWAEVNLALWGLRVPVGPGWGPAQRAAALAQRVPEAAAAVERILEAYLRLRYAPPWRAVVAVAAVRQARRMVRRAVVRSWFQGVWHRLLGRGVNP